MNKVPCTLESGAGNRGKGCFKERLGATGGGQGGPGLKVAFMGFEWVEEGG